MKKSCFLIICTLLVLSGCQPDSVNKTPDLDSVEASVSALADLYQGYWKGRNADALIAMLDDNGFYCGTDPGELLNKDDLAEMWTQYFSDSTHFRDFKPNTRKIHVSADGQSAIVMEQIALKELTPNFPVRRQTMHVVKVGEDWKIDFISWSFLINNEDIEKIDQAFAE
ncbi:nuclear transport factor 2 family protein [Bacteroidota bacterium]